MKAADPSDEEARFLRAVMARMDELFDGYVVVGFHALNGKPVVVSSCGGDEVNAQRTGMALRQLLLQAATLPVTINPGNP